MNTLDEYKNAVKEALMSLCIKYMSPAGVEGFFNTKEAQELITARYEVDIKKLESGEITEEVFKNGCVQSVACCLELMMD